MPVAPTAACGRAAAERQHVGVHPQLDHARGAPDGAGAKRRGRQRLDEPRLQAARHAVGILERRRDEAGRLHRQRRLQRLAPPVDVPRRLLAELERLPAIGNAPLFMPPGPVNGPSPGLTDIDDTDVPVDVNRSNSAERHRYAVPIPARATPRGSDPPPPPSGPLPELAAAPATAPAPSVSKPAACAGARVPPRRPAGAPCARSPRAAARRGGPRRGRAPRGVRGARPRGVPPPRPGGRRRPGEPRPAGRRRLGARRRQDRARGRRPAARGQRAGGREAGARRPSRCGGPPPAPGGAPVADRHSVA